MIEGRFKLVSAIIAEVFVRRVILHVLCVRLNMRNLVASNIYAQAYVTLFSLYQKL